MQLMTPLKGEADLFGFRREQSALAGEPISPDRLMFDIEGGVHQNDVVVDRGGLCLFGFPFFREGDERAARGGHAESETGLGGGAKEVATIGHGASGEFSVFSCQFSVSS